MAHENRRFNFANNARSTLAASLASSATELTVQAFHGGRFPTADVTLGEIFSCILFSSDLSSYEIVYAISKGGDVFTIERAKEGTVARDFPAGAVIVHNATAAFFDQIAAPRPSAVVLSGVIDGEDVDLTWTESIAEEITDPVAAYDVYRSEGGGNFGLLASVAAPALTYTDTDVSLSAHEYAYHVVARTVANRESDQSNTVELSLIPPSELVILADVWRRDGTAKWAHATNGTSDGVFTVAAAAISTSCLPILPIYPKPSIGKYYYEVRYTQSSNRLNAGFQTRWGFGAMAEEEQASQEDSTSQIGGVDALVWLDGYEASGNATLNIGDGTTQNVAGGQVNVPSTIMVAVDFGASKIWIGKDGVWLGSGTQNPATGQGGFWPTDALASRIAGATPRHWWGPWISGDFSTTGEQNEFRFSQQHWTLTPPAGFGTFSFWQPGTSPSNTPAFVDPNPTSFSFDNLRPGLAITSGTAAALRQFRSNNPKSTGKRYFEVTLFAEGGTGDGNLVLGLVRQSAISTDDVDDVGVGVTAAGVVSRSDGTHGVYSNTSWANTIDGRTLDQIQGGDTIMVAVDFNSNRAYFGANGVWYNGQDPTSGIGGIELPAVASDWVPALSTITAGFYRWLFNTGGLRFFETMPAGYVGWDE